LSDYFLNREFSIVLSLVKYPTQDRKIATKQSFSEIAK
jgi:hypothetical protein